VVNLLSLSLLAKPAAEASELATAIGDTTNADKIKSTESYWIANRPADPAPPPTAAQATIDPETAKSRLAQASQTNSTAVYLAYITTFGFFILVFTLIYCDRYPGALGPLATPVQQSAPAVSGGTATSSPSVAPATLSQSAAPSTSFVSPYRDILMTLMGVIGTAWAGIISFYFGSSVGSRQQSETLQDISRGAITQGGQGGGAPAGGSARQQPG
jgi:hypothetical protein